ncbi:DUF2437 domain-containing protein [Brucella intermedia GD04153]|uniref:DUF2437 domain-containing protein n=1 Tax=Brucella intermedia GD04153 TaxID=2975438 RepID=A0AA42KVQ7_9HYPH|nr:Rv2993c-like domain-containing protein [Brucella intermedia]MDH0126862.1 DUF2437 domain-containing protein [Brucella intermedia GD04153]
MRLISFETDGRPSYGLVRNTLIHEVLIATEN